MSSLQTTWQPDLLFTNGVFKRDAKLACDANGKVVAPVDAITRLKGRAILPGLVNAHSHAFQRVIRGRTEHRTANQQDSFWTWREMMYRAALRLTPEDVYDASRMAFLEMALRGVPAVVEFYYLDDSPYG